MIEREYTMDYQTIAKETEGHSFPVFGANESEELTVILQGEDGAGKFFKINTCQFNGWIRTNIYYENGDICELYSRSLKGA